MGVRIRCWDGDDGNVWNFIGMHCMDTLALHGYFGSAALGQGHGRES